MTVMDFYNMLEKEVDSGMPIDTEVMICIDGIIYTLTGEYNKINIDNIISVGLDNYINKYIEIKMNSEGEKEEAKQLLNNLYGKTARNFTIRASQKNYNSANKVGLYIDTDSIHCNLPLILVGKKRDT